MSDPKLDRSRTGRAKGTPNKTTQLIKDAIIQAAELTGYDKHGHQGLIGYCRRLAEDEPKAFAGLMGKVLPTQVTGENGAPINLIIQQSDADLV